jgi:hypothetical protein
MRHDDLMLLGNKDGYGTFAYNEGQLVSAKIGMSDVNEYGMAEDEIQLQFSNGLIIPITASKYGNVVFEDLKVKYFRKN